MKRLLLLITLTSFVTLSHAQVYVNQAASGANNGTSWANAYTDLKTAIYNTTSGEIWVAQGTYKPTSGTDRSISFELKDNVQLYGGFLGTETVRSLRNYTNNETILSGDIGVESDTTDNTLHVVFADGSSTPITNTSVLDGFTIRDGNTTASAGGGIVLSYAAPLISNCKIINNRSGKFGGAIFCQFSNPLFFNTTFENNEAINAGGAVYLLFSNLSFTNCTFLDNTSQNGGGAILGAGLTTGITNLFITNCLFEDNSSSSAGGAILLYNTNLYTDASVFNLNHSDSEGGVFNINGGTSDIKNCTFSQNGATFGGGAIVFNDAIGTISHCLFKSNFAGNLFSPIATSFGGAIINESNADLTIINSVFKSNNCFTSGGAIVNDANLNIYNSSFYQNNLFTSNFSYAAGAIYNTLNLNMYNTILYENYDQNSSFPDYVDDVSTTSTITNCIGKGFPNYTTNADVNPLFDNTIMLTLQSNSPAIDAGDNSVIPAGVTTDFFGNSRITNGTVDIGVHEFGACDYITNNRIYVDANNNSGIYNGHNWGSAFQDLQTALTLAQSCAAVQEIWVANGTYYPTSGTDRTVSFELQDGVTIYGGFAGNEFSFSNRDIENNPTILSGDIGIVADDTDNAYHVVQSISNDNTAILDGFIIEKGNANIVDNNSGGGYYGDASDAIIQNCTFRDNNANNGGGLAHENTSTPQIVNSIFYNNNAVDGAALHLSNCDLTLTNCTITENTASGSGGGIFKTGGTVTVTNSILWNNLATTNNELNGSGFTVNHSIIEGGYAGTNNLNQNPFFVDATNKDFSVGLCSPAINTGTVVTHKTDILGNPHSGTVDIGAYEYQGITYNYTTAIYVDVNATGNNDGSSWANAFTDLQDAIDNHCGDFDIWVAAGTYLPTKDHTGSNAPTDNREKNFHLHKDMKIYGGFNGTETLLTQRDWATNVTILSGDLNSDDVITGSDSTLSIMNNTENSYHVLITANLTNASVIDGFMIRNGNADDPIANLISIRYQTRGFLHANGGGMYNAFSSPMLKNIIFEKNTTNNRGGGMYNNASSPSFINTIFANNLTSNDGGGMYNLLSSPSITNTTFTNNVARSDGGGIFNSSASVPTITNTIFWNNIIIGITNVAFNNIAGADIENRGTTATVSYSLTQKNSIYSSGTGIINNINPVFVDAANGDFRLQSCSPAFNAGTTVAHTTDILSNPHSGVVDIGAYEIQGVPSNAIYVNVNAGGNNNGTSWADAYTNLQDAIDDVCGNFDIWVAAGTYLPTKDHTGNKTPTDNREKNFHLHSNKKIYGGFDGTETLLSERNWKTNLTILSGDFDNNDVVTGGGSTLSISNNSENAYHVLITTNLTKAALIDGFIIKGGNANRNGLITYQSSGFNSNRGAGMHNNSSSPTIANTIFENNATSDLGGGLYNNFSSPTIANTIFKKNKAKNGAGMYNTTSSPTIVNSTFVNNRASTNGGGMYNGAASPKVTNATFVNNAAISDGGGMYNFFNCSPIITNTIFWNNARNGNTNTTGSDIRNLSNSTPIVSYCLFKTTAYGSNVGMVNGQSPLFLDEVNGDFRLQFCSPATNAGTADTTSLNLGLVDLDGNPRVFGGRIEMGAYEFQSFASANPLLITTTNDDGCGSLRDVVANAAPGDTIRFDAVIDGDTIKLTSGQITLNKNLVIIGNDSLKTIISGTNKSRVFSVSSGIDIYLFNMSITKGYSNSNGGGIKNDGSLAISGTKISENTVISSASSPYLKGGGLFNTGNLNISDSQVGDNLVSTSGSSSYARGGGIYNEGIANLNAVQIHHNSSYTSGNNLADGGGILNGGTLRISNSTIDFNTAISTSSAAEATGGGLNSWGSLTILNSKIRANAVSSPYTTKGGGISLAGSASKIINCIISGNRAYTSGGYYSSRGGGIHNRGGLNLTNTTVSGNSSAATNSNGGGIYNESISAQLVLKNSIVAYNISNLSGGDIYSSIGSSIVSENSLVEDSNGSHGISSYNGIDPFFVQNVPVAPSTGGDLRLQSCSPVTNAGTADTTGLNLTLIDLDGNPRVFGGRIDIGAYELQTDPFMVTASALVTEICHGSTLNLNALAENANVAVTYAWTGPNGFTGNTQNPVLSNPDSGMYVVTAVSGLCIVRDSIKITFPAGINFTTSPSEFNEIFACENGSIKLASGAADASNYQWQIDTGSGYTNLTEASPYSQTNSDSLVINPISLSMDGYQLRALIADACGGSIISDTITLRVGELPVLVTSPLTQEVCPGNEVVLEAAFTGSGFYYQWQLDAGSGFVNVSGPDYSQIGNKLLVSNFDYAKNNNQYRALAKSTCFEVPSSAATITINTDVTILAQPMSQTVCEFGTAIFTAQAVKLSAGALTFQWQRKSGVGVWTDINTGGRYIVNGNQLSIANAPASWNGAEFRCLMNDYCQTIPKTLNVIPVAHVTQNPVNQEICVGNNANFSITAAGQGLAYRWQVNTGSGFMDLTDGGIYQGATSANLSLSFPSATVNNNQYRCVVSGTSTCDLEADTSAIASISVGIAAEAQTVFFNSDVSTTVPVTQAVAYILGINSILAPDGKAEYRAGNSIILNPGFEVEAGAVFLAKIMNPCVNTTTSFDGVSSVPKEKVK